MDNNCFFLNTDNECLVLTDRDTCGAECSFRKTQAEFEAAQLTADRRLASLPENRQCKIAIAYYRGQRPWRTSIRKAAGV